MFIGFSKIHNLAIIHRLFSGFRTDFPLAVPMDLPTSCMSGPLPEATTRSVACCERSHLGPGLPHTFFTPLQEAFTAPKFHKKTHPNCRTSVGSGSLRNPLGQILTRNPSPKSDLLDSCQKGPKQGPLRGQ